MPDPIITTVIPTFRRPQQLQKAIQSALGQSFRNITVNVYDNASGDETESVVKKLMKQDARVQYFCHAKNIGAYQNFQFGIDRIKTPFFSLLSDDDELLPNFYETAVQIFNRYPNAAFCAGKGIIKNKQGEILGESLQDWKRFGYFIPPDGLVDIARNTVLWTATLFRAKPVHALGGFDELIGFAQDYDFILRLGKSAPFYIIDTPCAVFFEHQGSFSNKTLALEKAESLMKFFAKHRDVFEASEEAYAHHMRTIGTYYMVGNKPHVGRRFLWDAVKTWPKKENMIPFLISLGGSTWYTSLLNWKKTQIL